MQQRLLDIARTVYHRGRQKPARWLHTRAASNPTPHEERLLAQLHQRGVAVIENYFTAERCQTLLKAVEDVFATHAAQLWRSKEGGDVRAYRADAAHSLIAEYAADPFLLQLAERYVGQPQVNFFTLANRVLPVEGNLGSGAGWHRDSAAEHQFKALLYLSDVGPENGAFQYVPGSHRVRSLVRSVMKGAADFGQHRFTDEQFQAWSRSMGMAPQTFTGKAGTLLVADTSGVHRGSPIHSGSRHALTNYYYTQPQIEAFRQQRKFTGYFVVPEALA